MSMGLRRLGGRMRKLIEFYVTKEGEHLFVIATDKSIKVYSREATETITPKLAGASAISHWKKLAAQNEFKLLPDAAKGGG
jgi:hypothetical protein